LRRLILDGLEGVGGFSFRVIMGLLSLCFSAHRLSGRDRISFFNVSMRTHYKNVIFIGYFFCSDVFLLDIV
jgi:hypothetical protein